MASTPKHEYYETLGVPRKADTEDSPCLSNSRENTIRLNRRQVRRALQKRPGSSTRAQRPQKRPMYDQFGFIRKRLRRRRSQGAAGGPQGAHSMVFDFSDCVQPGRAPPRANSGSGGFATSSPSSWRWGRRTNPEHGADLEYVMNIDFWQAIKGTTARQYHALRCCTTCHGTGSTARASRLPQCRAPDSQQMAGATKFNLSCPLRHRSPANATPPAAAGAFEN